MVSGRHRTTLRRAKRLRRSSVVPRPPPPAPRPCSSPPRHACRPRPAPRRSAAPGAAGILAAAAPAPGGGRPGVLNVTERSGERKGAQAAAPSAAPRGRRPQAARQQETGGKNVADACGTRTIPVRQRAALPRFARLELRAVSTALPPRLRDVLPAPLPAPRRGLGGGWGPRAPRSAHTRAGGRLSARENARGASCRGGHRLRDQKTQAQPGSPQGPAPHYPSGKSRAPLQEARGRQKPRETETRPGCGMGGSGGSPAPADTRPVSRSAAPVSRPNHRDHLRRLARYSPPRDRPARPTPPRAAILHPGQKRRPFPRLGKNSTCH